MPMRPLESPSRLPERMRRGLLGMYALAVMDREGPVHGYLISERVAERTDGSWRPGPGAVYPALRKLAERGFARPAARSLGRRREFEITPQGRAMLERLRAQSPWVQRKGWDLVPLWAEVSGIHRTEDFLLLRLRRALDGIDTFLARSPDRTAARAELISEVERELGGYLRRMRHTGERTSSSPRSRSKARFAYAGGAA
ncbi:MAG: PadR family transcriptional regulator [Euryarchaeota archaeon]|nr:PadR family transcriptional regulator [Euryarchaeota archaeon]MDE1835356.1 PadR family transcriptional regulator [Euryarchaeota archaeon]MDE1880749.1 PadR family transcriptional regulator [Euryarchaeota archaeon]MDE2043652.1 PadR family transcriptional regulator [Thermoplasmata archaeon]